MGVALEVFGRSVDGLAAAGMKDWQWRTVATRIGVVTQLLGES